MSMNAESLGPLPAGVDFAALIHECEQKVEEHQRCAGEFMDLRDQLVVAKEVTDGVNQLTEKVREALAAAATRGRPPLRVVPQDPQRDEEDAPADGPVLLFKRGTISAAILAIMADDPSRTAPWSVNELTAALNKTTPAIRSRVSANAEHVFRRGALEKVYVATDPAHVYYRISAAWGLTD